MPSDRRLHPLSVLFALGAQFRQLALPAVVLLFTTRSGGWNWELWAPLLLIPAAIVASVKYLSMRYRYEPHEMVVRTGILFRNERHVPYARIQNLDAVQGVFHRLLNVVEVRVQTGGGKEPEAILKVLPVADFEEMRRRVFEGRGEAAAPAPASEEAAGDAAVPAPAPGRTLLHLPLRELILLGLIQNRGVVVIAGAFGVFWEMGVMDAIGESTFGQWTSGRNVARDVFRSVFGQIALPLDRIGLTLAALAGLLVLVRLISMVWAVFRLHDFRLTRAGDDLHTEYGLLTKVSTTIPLHRIQTLTILEGPVHQLLKRVSVRVDTAGGNGGEEGSTQREWLAPILRPGELPGLLQEVLPEVDLAAVDWRAAHPRAFRREYKGSVIVAVLVSLALTLVLKGWVLLLLPLLLAWGYVAARLTVKHYGWAVSDGAVLYRSGWLWKKTSIARFTKIQAVALHESPFDRRHAMARVRVDTAGAGDLAHRVDIPYLARETASDLYDLLAARTARTAFRW
jgi:putative membrane protein